MFTRNQTLITIFFMGLGFCTALRLYPLTLIAIWDSSGRLGAAFTMKWVCALIWIPLDVIFFVLLLERAWGRRISSWH